jgi:hypothetical protein
VRTQLVAGGKSSLLSSWGAGVEEVAGGKVGEGGRAKEKDKKKTTPAPKKSKKKKMIFEERGGIFMGKMGLFE